MSQPASKQTSATRLIHAAPDQESMLLKIGLTFALCFCASSAAGLIISGMHIVLLLLFAISTIVSGMLIFNVLTQYRHRVQVGQAIFEQHQPCILGQDALIGCIITAPTQSKRRHSIPSTYRVQLHCIYEKLSGEISDYDYRFGGPSLWESEEIQSVAEGQMFTIIPPKHLPPSIQSKDKKKRNRWILTTSSEHYTFQFEVPVDTSIESHRCLHAPV